MAHQIPENTSLDDAEALVPLVIDAAEQHQNHLERYLSKTIGRNWLNILKDREQTMTAAIKVLAKEKVETTHLTTELQTILQQLPNWRRYILNLAGEAFKKHSKRSQFLASLGRGKILRSDNVRICRDYLMDVVPEVNALRQALLDVGGKAKNVDAGAAWLAALESLKKELAREKAEDIEASQAASKARDAMVGGLRSVIFAANSSAFTHPEVEVAVAVALEEGERRIRRRNHKKS